MEAVCIVHAGGKGERLKPLTLRVPKPLISIGIKQEPIIYWSMLPAMKAGIKRFVITTNYMSSNIEKYFKKKEWSGFDITISKEPKRLGRAGSTMHCLKEGIIGRELTVMQNAADITRNIVSDLIKDYKRKKKFEATVVAARKCIIPSSMVRFDERAKSIFAFERRPVHEWKKGFGSHVGMFLFGPKAMKRFESVPIPSDPEETVIQDLVNEGKANVFLTDRWLQIKYASDVENAKKIDIEKFQEI